MSVSQFSPLDSWRQAGCSAACWRRTVLILGEREKTLLECHDVASHETYARGLIADDILEIGPLRIDRRLMRVQLAGQPLYVTPIEYSLLLTIAERTGSIVQCRDILDRVWGTWLTGKESDLHMLRVTVARLRDRLGSSAWLIATKAGFGYWMPASVPSDAPPPEPAPPWRQHQPKRMSPWPLGQRQQTLLDLLRRSDGHRVSVQRAAVHVYGKSTSETRSTVRSSARAIQRGSLVVEECCGPLPEGGWIWIEEGAS